MSTAQLLVGPLGPFEPDEDTHVVVREDGRWLVSERSTKAALRLSDANPCGTVAAFAAPSGHFATELGVEPGRAELFSDGLLIAGIAPGEWLALTPGTGAALAATLGGLAGGEEVVLVDRSGGLAVFRLTGASAGELLAELCDDVRSARSLADGAVLSSAVAGLRCTVVRDDLLPEELLAGFDLGGFGVLDLDELDATGGPPGEGPVDAEYEAPLVASYLLVCDRSLARELHTRVLTAGGPDGIEAEGFARYRSYHRDV
ncbi:MAG: hypothetical protein IT196_21140 [Acidimicrobiales bacterium]|nr:hypothetical protein [Acidimicrobiales bacterium]